MAHQSPHFPQADDPLPPASEAMTPDTDTPGPLTLASKRACRRPNKDATSVGEASNLEPATGSSLPNPDLIPPSYLAVDGELQAQVNARTGVLTRDASATLQ
jgi:hypothetical protein